MELHLILNSLSFKRSLYDALYSSEQDEYNVNILPGEVTICVDYDNVRMKKIIKTKLENKPIPADISLIQYKISRKSVERLCTVLNCILEQPVRVVLTDNKGEDPVISFTV